MKTIDYIETIKKTNDATYYKVAQLLEINHSTISRYRKKERYFDDETCLKVAELLEIDPAIVLADIHAERAKIRKTKDVWEKIATALRATAATAIIAVSTQGFLNDFNRLDKVNSANYTYYVKWILVQLISLLFSSLSVPANIRRSCA